MPTTNHAIDFTDVEAAAKTLAGNWRQRGDFSWDRAAKLPDAGNWLLFCLRTRDSVLTEISNAAVIKRELVMYSRGRQPNVFYETFRHYAGGGTEEVAVRVYRRGQPVPTSAFIKFCSLCQRLCEYPWLDENAYSEEVHEATLANYVYELGRAEAAGLPADWPRQVFEHFNDVVELGMSRCVENVDDRGGWASREQLLTALRVLGLCS